MKLKSYQTSMILLSVCMIIHPIMALPTVLEHAFVDSDATISVYDTSKSELAKHNNNCRIAFSNLMIISCEDGWLAFLKISELGKFIVGDTVESLNQKTSGFYITKGV